MEFDFSSIKGARRAIIILGVLLLALAAVDLSTNEVEAFGIQISVSEDDIASALWIALAFALLAFAGRGFAALPAELHELFRNLDEQWKAGAEAAVREIETHIENRGPPPDPFDDYDGFYYRGIYKKHIRQNRLERLHLRAKLISIILLDYVVYLAFGGLTLFYPEALLSLLEVVPSDAYVVP